MPADIYGDILTEILHRAVLAAPNGKAAKAVASVLGKGHTLLLNELNPAQERNKFDADLVLPLCIATGSDEPVLWLARQMNLACIRLPQAGPGSGSSCREAMKVVKEVGEVMGEYEKALQDGKVDARERRSIGKQIDEAVEQLLTFRRILEDQED